MALRTRSWEARSSLAPTNTSLSNLQTDISVRAVTRERREAREHRSLVEERGPGSPPAGPQKGGVQEVWSVGGSDHKHILSAVEPVQLSQELRHNPGGREEAEARVLAVGAL